MSNSETGKLISSKEILDKTGISRATLNNYIKMGVLPRPLVRKAGPEDKGAKQIGYFAEAALERIATVKRLKREGLSMEEISKRLKMVPLRPETEVRLPEDEPATAARPIGRSLPSIEEIAEKFKDVSIDSRSAGGAKTRGGREESRHGRAEAGRRIEDKDLKVSIGEIRTPAYLINHNFEIEWINKQAEDQVFNKSIRSIIDVESRNVFRLFFTWEFHIHLRNWEEVIAAHMRVLRSRIPRNNLMNLYNGITSKETSFLEKIYDIEDSTEDLESISYSPVSFVMQHGEIANFKIYTISFREGIFFVYIPTDQANHELMQILSNRGRIISELLNQRMPSLVSLCVLVADIQDSVKICAELLPEEYFEMVNGLWKKVGGCFEKYNGICGKHAGDGMLYYFIKRPGANYIMDAINCALEVRDKMREFSCDWKLRKGWPSDIYLNTAINEGQEFFGAIHSAANVEFTALGDSINYTGRLCDFARYGSIWTTKNVISKLGQEERNKIRFGVRRKDNGHEIFLENSFSRIIDMMGENGRNGNQFLDIATLPITEIIEKNPDGE